MGAPELPDKPFQSRRAVFFQRAMSTLILWILVAVALAFESQLLFSVLIVVIGTLALLEFLGLLELEGTPGWYGIRWGLPVVAVSYLGAVAFVCSKGEFTTLALLDPACLVAVVLVTTLLLLFHPVDGKRTKDMFFGSVFGFLYTVILSSFLLRVLYFTAGNNGSGVAMTGQYYLLFLLVVTKFSDMGGYVVGTMIGRHKMIPHISPGKTWEGFIFGCLVFSVAGGCAVFAMFGERMPLLTWPHVAILGFVLGIVAVAGDLAESIVKRCLVRKDSGHALPGIGGVLDLIDSILFTSPVLFFYLKAIS